jgi:hypothetical protein
MRRIAERAEIRVVRSRDIDLAVRAKETVKLLHGADDVGDMLYHVNRAHMVERAVRERIRKTVEIAKDIGSRTRDSIDADRAGVLVYTAANV